MRRVTVQPGIFSTQSSKHRGALGRPLKIEVTISHRFLVADRDVKRFAELNVHANFSPHWFGGTFYGKAGEINVGPERASRSQVAGHFVRQQANVTLSSDVVHNPRRVNPFLGMEMSVTRRATDKPDAITLPPLDAGISLEQAKPATPRSANPYGPESTYVEAGEPPMATPPGRKNGAGETLPGPY